MIEVRDIRGLPLGDERRKTAYPVEPPPRPLNGYEHLFEPMTYSHVMSTSWYFDASDPANEAEADRVIADLCFAAETYKPLVGPLVYKPCRIVIDNYGGTIVGRRKDA